MTFSNIMKRIIRTKCHQPSRRMQIRTSRSQTPEQLVPPWPLRTSRTRAVLSQIYHRSIRRGKLRWRFRTRQHQRLQDQLSQHSKLLGVSPLCSLRNQQTTSPLVTWKWTTITIQCAPLPNIPNFQCKIQVDSHSGRNLVNQRQVEFHRLT